MAITPGSSEQAGTVYSSNSTAQHWQNYTWYKVGKLTDTSVTLNLACGIRSTGWGMSINGGICGSTNFVKTADGSTTYSSPDTTSNYREVWGGFYSDSGSWTSATLCEGSITITRSKVAQTWGLWTKTVNSSGYDEGESTSAVEVIVPALASYTISYNANKGSGAPSSQTKWYGTNLTLSSTKPTRTNYTFLGWATSSTATSASYQPGATYSANANLTLYAVWKANTYTVSYNANGGTGAPSNQTKTADVNLTLSSTKPTRTNYTFLGWATSSTATSASYQPGATYSANANLTLYAVWQLAYVAPRISNISATRYSDSAATTKDDGGAYVKLTFSWKTDKTVSSIKAVGAGKTTTISASGTSGSVSVILSGFNDAEASYIITVTVADANGNSSSIVNVAGTHYIFDCDKTGDFAVGGVAGPITTSALYNTNKVATEYSPGTIFYDAVRYKHVQVGISGRGSSSTTWSWRRLVKSKNPKTTGWGAVHITGFMGNLGVNAIAVDWYTTLKYSSTTPPVYSATNLYGANEAYTYARIVVTEDAAGYVSVWFAGQEYFHYDFLIQGDDIDVLDETPTTTTPSETVVYNSGQPWNATYGCKVIPNGYGPQFAKNIYATYLSANGFEDSSSNVHGKLIFYWGDNYTDTGGIGGNVYKQIWSGSWSVGSTLTIAKAYLYNMFLIQVNGFASLVPCYRNYNLQKGSTAADTFGGSAAMPSATAASLGDIWMSTVRISMAKDATTKLTLERCCNFNLTGSTWNTKTVTKVFGVI